MQPVEKLPSSVAKHPSTVCPMLCDLQLQRHIASNLTAVLSFPVLETSCHPETLRILVAAILTTEDFPLLILSVSRYYIMVSCMIPIPDTISRDSSYVYKV